MLPTDHDWRCDGVFSTINSTLARRTESTNSATGRLIKEGYLEPAAASSEARGQPP